MYTNWSAPSVLTVIMTNAIINTCNVLATEVMYMVFVVAGSLLREGNSYEN